MSSYWPPILRASVCVKFGEEAAIFFLHFA